MSLFNDDDDDDERDAVAAFVQQQQQAKRQGEQARSAENTGADLIDSLFGQHQAAAPPQKGADGGAVSNAPKHLAAFAAAKDVRRKDKEQLALDRIALQNAAEQAAEGEAGSLTAELRRKDREMGVFRTRAYAAARGGTAGKQHVQAAQPPREQPQQAASDEQEWLSFANAAQPANSSSSSAAVTQQSAVAEGGGVRSIPVVVLARRRDAADDDGLAALENETDEERLQRLNQIVLAAKLRRKDAKAMQRASAAELAAAADVFRAAQVARDAELMRKR